jgi:hypothetical protein
MTDHRPRAPRALTAPHRHVSGQTDTRLSPGATVRTRRQRQLQAAIRVGLTIVHEARPVDRGMYPDGAPVVGVS